MAKSGSDELSRLRRRVEEARARAQSLENAYFDPNAVNVMGAEGHERSLGEARAGLARAEAALLAHVAAKKGRRRGNRGRGRRPRR